MKVIMISAKSQHGKDTVAQFLKEELEKQNFRVMTIHFADPVKWFAREYMGYKGVKDEVDRSILQTLGTEIMRKQYPTYWADLIAKFIHATQRMWDYVLIPDTRFFNEIESVCKYNSNTALIRVERLKNGIEYQNPQMTEQQLNHISETELDNANFDYIIYNTGSLEELKDNVKIVIQDL